MGALNARSQSGFPRAHPDLQRRSVGLEGQETLYADLDTSLRRAPIFDARKARPAEARSRATSLREVLFDLVD
ncbi:MAG: hypothetical protein WCD75_16640, partial [Rhodoplanes sp.]